MSIASGSRSRACLFKHQIPHPMAQAAAPLFKFCFRPGRQVAVLSCSRAIDQRWLVFQHFHHVQCVGFPVGREV